MSRASTNVAEARAKVVLLQSGRCGLALRALSRGALLLRENLLAREMFLRNSEHVRRRTTTTLRKRVEMRRAKGRSVVAEQTAPRRHQKVDQRRRALHDDPERQVQRKLTRAMSAPNLAALALWRCSRVSEALQQRLSNMTTITIVWSSRARRAGTNHPKKEANPDPLHPRNHLNPLPPKRPPNDRSRQQRPWYTPREHHPSLKTSKSPKANPRLRTAGPSTRQTTPSGSPATSTSTARRRRSRTLSSKACPVRRSGIGICRRTFPLARRRLWSGR